MKRTIGLFLVLLVGCSSTIIPCEDSGTLNDGGIIFPPQDHCLEYIATNPNSPNLITKISCFPFQKECLEFYQCVDVNPDCFDENWIRWVDSFPQCELLD